MELKKGVKYSGAVKLLFYIAWNNKGWAFYNLRKY